MVAFKTVLRKELEDHFNSWRFITLFLLIFLPSIYYIWRVLGNIQQTVTSATSTTFLEMFTRPFTESTLPILPTTFYELVVMLIPIVGIALGLDAINSERNNGTLSHLIAQPIYRDNVINAKFMAGVLTIAVIMTSVVLISCGLGVRILGIIPSAEEAWRIFFFLIMSIVYGCFWLGLSILFSILFKRVSASALVSVAVWLFFAIIFQLIIMALGNNIDVSTPESAMSGLNTIITVSRISPMQLFNEACAFILLPEAKTMYQILVLMTQDAGSFFMDSPLSLGQSLLTVWPQLVITILLTVICFAISYIKFMYEEIRAT